MLRGSGSPPCPILASNGGVKARSVCVHSYFSDKQCKQTEKEDCIAFYLPAWVHLAQADVDGEAPILQQACSGQADSTEGGKCTHEQPTSWSTIIIKQSKEDGMHTQAAMTHADSSPHQADSEQNVVWTKIGWPGNATKHGLEDCQPRRQRAEGRPVGHSQIQSSPCSA